MFVRALLVVFCLGTFIDLATADITPVEGVDLHRYSGTWYEIARFPFKQQEGCLNTTATYSLKPDGGVRVVNRCRRDSFDGPESVAVGKARVVDSKTNAKLQVKFFFLAPWADYWIVRLGENYEYAVVTQPGYRFLWILSRSPQMETSVYTSLVESLRHDGVPTERLVLTPQQWGEL